MTPSGTGRRPGRWLTACPAGRRALANMGRTAEAVDDGRRSLAVARELGYPAGEALALSTSPSPPIYAGDLDGAVQLARQAEQIPADIPGQIARACSILLTHVLTAAGDLAAAERICAAGLAQARDAGDLQNQARLLTQMATLDLQAGRIQDAAAHLREALQIAVRTGMLAELLTCLDCCGYLCAATGRRAEALTVWAAYAALCRHEGFTDDAAERAAGRNRCARPGRRSGPPGRGRPRSAARR